MKQIIDKFFLNFYSILKTYASKYINKIGKKIEVDMLLSDCYCYLIKYNWQKQPSDSDLEGLSKTYIKNNIRWTRSQITTQNAIKENVQLDTLTGDYNTITIGPDRINELIDGFFNELNREEKNIFNIYYYKNINSAKKISSHLNISLSYSYPILRTAKQLEDRLRDYIKENME